MDSLASRHSSQVAGTLSCVDRALIRGTPVEIGFPGGVGRYLKNRNVPTQDFPRWAEGLSESIRENARRAAAENGLEIEYIRKKNFRKEDRVAQVLKQRGTHPGLVHIFAAMETCTTFRVRWKKDKKKCWLEKTSGKCVHYYFYFLDPDFGLVFFRVATWAPFHVHFYFNGHSWLAAQLSRRGIGYTLLDNAFVAIADWGAAQKLAQEFDVKHLHKALDQFAAAYCPVIQELGLSYHWSLYQIEYSTDLAFKTPDALRELFQPLIRAALLAVKADDVARILGRRMPKTGELSSGIHKRGELICLKHRMEWVSIKVYDKFQRVLRIETTLNDPSIFNHYRQVVQKDGQIRFRPAKVRKTIYSLEILRGKLGAANQRYLDFLSALEVPLEGAKRLQQLAQPIRHDDRPYRGFNLFHGTDQKLFETLARGEFAISGFRNADLRKHLSMTTAATSRCLRRLALHDLIRKIPGTFKYVLTAAGRRAIVCALALKETLLAPAFSRIDHEKIFANLPRI